MPHSGCSGGSRRGCAYVTSLVKFLGAIKVVRTDQEVFKYVPVDDALLALGDLVTTVARWEDRSRESLWQEIIEADIGITEADCAVAETGSVVVVPGKGLSRLVSLVPPVQLALVRPQDVVETIDDLLLLRLVEYHRRGGDMGSYLNFITGPRHTADIEQTIVVGVHGPREVDKLLIEECA